VSVEIERKLFLRCEYHWRLRLRRRTCGMSGRTHEPFGVPDPWNFNTEPLKQYASTAGGSPAGRCRRSKATRDLMAKNDRP
jgi:hypothetical protein